MKVILRQQSADLRRQCGRNIRRTRPPDNRRPQPWPASGHVRLHHVTNRVKLEADLVEFPARRDRGARCAGVDARDAKSGYSEEGRKKFASSV